MARLDGLADPHRVSRTCDCSGVFGDRCHPSLAEDPSHLAHALPPPHVADRLGAGAAGSGLVGMASG